MATTTAAAARPPRNPVVLAFDIIAGIAFALLGLVTSIGVTSTVGQYPALVPACGSAIEGGVPCDAGGLVTAVVIAVSAIAIFAFALGLGFLIVRLLQKRLAFYWPIIGIVITIAAFYIGTAVVGSTAS